MNTLAPLPLQHLERLTFTVRFITPAFLGNAEQQAQWRTPPFKALIRQWWRVVKANECGYDHRRLLAAENALFGSASDEHGGGSLKSRVRFRLDRWDGGDYRTLESSDRVCHPEVERGGPPCQTGPGRMIDANLYLGYGPVGTQGLARPPAIAPLKDEARLRITAPEANTPAMVQAIQLAAWFGTLGSRSRNGWGALIIEGDDIEPIGALSRGNKLVERVSRPLADCLALDWPHAIGNDKRPLVWKSAPMGTWREVMRELAAIKIGFSTQFKFGTRGPHPNMLERLLLAYPVTNHNHARLGGESRLANQIRFKVAREGNQYIGIIAHLPCAVPGALLAKLNPTDQNFVKNNQLSVWQAVHRVLDDPKHNLKRI